MHIFRATHIGVTCFFKIVAEGGHEIFDHQIGGHKDISEVLSEIYDPLFQRKWCLTMNGPYCYSVTLFARHVIIL